MDKQQTQKPVAWAVTVGSDIANQIGFFTDKAKADACFVEQAGEKYASLYLVQPLYLAPPVPRDVLMAFGEAVLVKAGAFMYESDIAALADRYASQVQPEPVNQQLLAALKASQRVISQLGHMESCKTHDHNGDVNYCDCWLKTAIHVSQCAIATAEAAQPVGDEPDFYIVTGGYDDLQEWGSELQWVATKDELKHLDRRSLYRGGYYAKQPASAQPVAVPDERCPHCCGSGVMPKAAIAPPPPDVPCRNCNGTGKVRAMLSASQKGGAA